MKFLFSYLLGIATTFFFIGIGLALWMHSREPLLGVAVAIAISGFALNIEQKEI